MGERAGGVFRRLGANGSNRVLLSGSSSLGTPAERALDRVIRSGHPASVLRLYLSRLDATGPKPEYHRVARCLFDDAVRHGGQVFDCGNADLVLIAEPGTVATLGAVLLRLFRAEATGDQQLIGLWSLPGDETVIRAEFAGAAEDTKTRDDLAAAPIGALAAVSTLLASASPGDLVRRHTAVRIEGRRVTALFQEVCVSFPALEAKIGMPVPQRADPYLFRYIAGQLDGRMLSSLAQADLSAMPALNIKLPLACAGSPVFRALQTAARRAGATLGAELPFVEAIADMTQFKAIRDQLQADGCTVVLDGIDHHALLHCDPAAMRADLLKLEWSGLIPSQPARDARRLRRAIEALGTERLMLCRAETETAVVWGLSQRITRFQGRHVDAMLAADRITACRFSRACTLGQCIDRAAATDAAGQAGCLDKALLGRMVPTGQPSESVA